MNVKSFTVGPVATKAYLAVDEATNTAFIVDPGDDAGRLLTALEREGAKLEYIILTHGHFDHVMAVPEVISKTGAKLVVQEDEVPALTDPILAGFTSFGITDMTELCADIVVKDGEKLMLGSHEFKFMHTPGHTKGSMCIMVGDMIFTGDTLFAGTCGRCDLPGGDYGEMLDSLKMLAELPGDYKLYPGHGEATALDIERKFNPYMREAIRR